MAVKANDAQAQQALDLKQFAGKRSLRLLTEAETRHVAAAAGDTIIRLVFTLDKSTPE